MRKVYCIIKFSNQYSCYFQWMIVDYNLFTPNQTLVPGTFWVLEQLPGTVMMSDMSGHLQTERYWASYNLPLVSSQYLLNLEPRVFSVRTVVTQPLTQPGRL